MKHVFALAELYLELGSVEAARDAYLASLDADDGLAVLLVPSTDIVGAAESRRLRPSCPRCGAKLPRRGRRCGRCRLRC